jgi:hypothetical protein
MSERGRAREQEIKRTREQENRRARGPDLLSLGDRARDQENSNKSEQESKRAREQETEQKIRCIHTTSQRGGADLEGRSVVNRETKFSYEVGELKLVVPTRAATKK